MSIFHNIQTVKNRKVDLIPYRNVEIHTMKFSTMKDDDTGLMA
jgi:predicted nucleotidyltransferase